jgi:hypothetical protein
MTDAEERAADVRLEHAAARAPPHSVHRMVRPFGCSRKGPARKSDAQTGTEASRHIATPAAWSVLPCEVDESLSRQPRAREHRRALSMASSQALHTRAPEPGSFRSRPNRVAAVR